MRRPLVVFAVAVLLCGCKGSSPASAPVDPFFGRTRIEPPRTGSIAAPRAYAPYYSPPRQASLPQTPAPPQSGGGWQPVSNTPSNPSPSSSKSGLRLQNISQPDPAPSSFPSAAPQGDLIVVPLEARRQTAAPETLAARPQPLAPIAPRRAVTPGPAAAASGTNAYLDSATSTFDAARRLTSTAYERGKSLLESRERIVRVIEPRATEASDASVHGSQTGDAAGNFPEPRRLSIPAPRPVDIMELPEVQRSGAVQGSPAAAGQSSIQLVSASEAIPPAEPVPHARYGYDPAYRWLIGRLEFSQAERLWRLRYIPVDGETDEFGGSVVLPNTPLLSGFERGDTVEVHGRLTDSESGTMGFAAGYEIHQIRRVGE